MSFPWLDRTPPRKDGSSQRARVAAEELASRAALFYRLGFSVTDATRRLTDRIAWEFEHGRPDALSDAAVAKIVSDTYARRPA